MARPTVYRRQRELLAFLRRYIAKFNYAPTLAEMAAALHVSAPSTIHGHLRALEKKGLIRRYRGAIRGIELIKDAPVLSQQVELPILGFIAAGSPIQSYTDPNATLLVPASMAPKNQPAFVLQVKGESMIDEGILDKDYIIVEKRADAHNGDVVVAELANGFATVKKFYQEKNRVRLEPANSKMAPLFVSDVTIRGRVVGVIRHLD